MYITYNEALPQFAVYSNSSVHSTKHAGVDYRQYKAAMQKRHKRIQQQTINNIQGKSAHGTKCSNTPIKWWCPYHQTASYAVVKSIEYKAAVPTALTCRNIQHARYLHGTTCDSTKYAIYKSWDKHKVVNSIKYVKIESCYNFLCHVVNSPVSGSISMATQEFICKFLRSTV